MQGWVKKNMEILKEQKGQGSMFALFSIVIGLILMVALLPVVNALVSEAINGNFSALLFSNVIILLLGMMGLIMALLFVMSVLNEFQRRQAPF